MTINTTLDQPEALTSPVEAIPAHDHGDTRAADRPADVDHALGKLIRLLYHVTPPAGSVPEMQFTEFSAWFHDRFHLEPGSCSAKALGDAVSFASRLGLIPVEKVARTKAKITYYTGIDQPTLDHALTRWTYMEALVRKPKATALVGNQEEALVSEEDALPEEPWDAAAEPEWLQAGERDAEFDAWELGYIDMFPNFDEYNIDF